MLNADTKRIINNARDILVGKVPNPQSQVDLITIAMIYKFMDDMDLEGFELSGKRTFFVGDLEQYAFSKLLDQKLGNQGRMNLYSEALDKLPLASSIPELFRTIFRGAFLPFRDPQTLTMFLKEINNFSYDNSENLGNAFEYLLSIMGSQGDAGQFRTPRHIIDFIVDVVKPQKDETILDPACGTAGFLISAYLYIKCHSPKISVSQMQTLNDNITGYDISPDMRKLALVNLYLHKFAEPKIYEYDTLTSEERWNDKFDVILANPPFMTPKGGIIPHSRFGVKANKSEVLFVDYIAEHLNLHGRAGVIVPEGIIFQSATAYKKLRKMLVDENYLYAVVSLPAGVFNPYSGVKTSILFFDRQVAKAKDDILFVKIENDGFDLGAQRREIAKNDLPTALEIIEKYRAGEDVADCKIAMVVSKDKIRENEEYNLTSGRYQIDSCAGKECKYPFMKLGEVCELIRGITYTKDDEVSANGLKVLRANNIDLGGTLNLEDVKEIKSDIKLSDSKKLKQNDIFICLASGSKQHIGKVAFIGKNTNFYFGGFMGAIRSKDNIEPKYLFQLLNSYLFNNYLINAISGVNINNLNAKILYDFKIPLPPMEVQREIVAEIENKQAAINHAREIIKDIERERFYFTSLLDGIKYDTVALGDTNYFEIGSGGTPATNNPEFWNGDIAWISLVDLPVNDGITNITATERTITEAGLKNSSAKILPVDSVVVSSRATIGRVGITKIPLATNQGFKNIIIKDFTKVNPIYLANAVAQLKEQMENLASGGTFKEISKSNFATLTIQLPSLADQERIVAALDEEQKIADANKRLVEIMQNKIANVITRIYNTDND
jgi:type I restriction enzyme M protein